MAIPSRFIDELVARSDIVDVVSEYVRLAPKSGSFWGLCPFHGEKTPSFHVVADRQIYHCFGCGKGGGVISFVMEIENLSFPDAVHVLAKKAGMQVPEDDENGAYRRRRERLLLLNKEAARFFHKSLYEEEGKSALEYLQARGLSRKTITNFGLGFAPSGWEHLLSAMGKLGYEKSELLESGLAVSGQKGRIYDRFRDRIMFPIINLRGNVIGFGGRILGDGSPKYLNSPDTVIFNKSQNLFALNLAKTSKFGRIILTEGYMDTIALHQAGFDSAVASLGTAFTAYHARLLARYTKEVIIAYDSDDAGVSAASRAIPLLEKAGLKVKVLRIKGAKDPDEYIKAYGRERFLQHLNQSEDHIEYSLAEIQQKYHLEEDAQRIDFAREAAEMISRLHSPVEREVYAGKVSELAGIEKDAVIQEVTRAFKRRRAWEKKKKERQDHLPVQNAQPQSRDLRYRDLRSAKAEEGVIRLLLLDDSLFQEVEDMEPQYFSSPFLRKLFELLLLRFEEGRSIHIGSLANTLTSEESAHLIAIMEKPEASEHRAEAMRDYRSVIEREYKKKAGESDEELFLAAWEEYQKKK